MYFNTGDLLLRDKDYYVYFVDRVGDTFRWKGENVSTLEVANVLTELKFVDDCTVYGVAIPHTDGRCGMAAYVLTKGTAVNPDLLKRIYVHSESNLPSYARPVFIRFLSELHLTGTFKHQKYVLQKEGYDIRLISEVYICNVKEGTYEKLTSDVHDQLISGLAQMIQKTYHRKGMAFTFPDDKCKLYALWNPLDTILPHKKHKQRIVY